MQKGVVVVDDVDLDGVVLGGEQVLFGGGLEQQSRRAEADLLLYGHDDGGCRRGAVTAQLGRFVQQAGGSVVVAGQAGIGGAARRAGGGAAAAVEDAARYGRVVVERGALRRVGRLARRTGWHLGLHGHAARVQQLVGGTLLAAGRADGKAVWELGHVDRAQGAGLDETIAPEQRSAVALRLVTGGQRGGAGRGADGGAVDRGRGGAHGGRCAQHVAVLVCGEVGGCAEQPFVAAIAIIIRVLVHELDGGDDRRLFQHLTRP